MNLYNWNQLEIDVRLRAIRVVTDKEKLQEISKLDGCYCLTTSLKVDELDKESVQVRYKEQHVAILLVL
ncbi:MAG: hypothetical protein LBC74_03640 [Planctomycetaceae bacterium]|jgi:hypothetical protein|nr:hypothetical protein [Planctomycetaceae bacterium]